MENGCTTLVELDTALQAFDTVSFRMALRRVEANWLLQALVVDSSARPPCPNWTCHNYGRVAFVAGMTPGGEVGKWILRQSGSVMGYDFQIPALQESVPWSRHPSSSPYGLSCVPWPYTRYALATSSQDTRVARDGFLVSENGPFFPDFQTAVVQLLYGVTNQHYGQTLLPDIGVIHVACSEAWIERIHLSPASISVTLAGSDLKETRVEISAPPDMRLVQRWEQAASMAFPLPKGLPPRLWVILSRGDKWLDYRYLDQQRSPFASQSESITIDPPDARTQIEGYISRGEGQTIEFKCQIPEKNDRMLKTIAAFANGEGGVILLGVDDESGDVVGMGGNVNEEKRRVVDMIRDNVVPEPEIRIDDCTIDGKRVIAVHVKEGNARPYGIHRDKPQFYVRRGATTFWARQEEIRDLALGAHGDASPPGAAWYPR